MVCDLWFTGLINGRRSLRVTHLKKKKEKCVLENESHLIVMASEKYYKQEEYIKLTHYIQQ